MQIILASAKIMNAKTAVKVPIETQPVYEATAERFALEMSSWSVEMLAEAFHCSMSIALENRLRFQSFFNDNEKMSALLAYNGHAYKYLQASSFSEADFRFAQSHLFITSFLYGLLCPSDKIHPYRAWRPRCIFTLLKTKTCLPSGAHALQIRSSKPSRKMTGC